MSAGVPDAPQGLVGRVLEGRARRGLRQGPRPSRGGPEDQLGLQRGPLTTAAAVWLGVQLLLALAEPSTSTRPWLLVAGALVGSAACAVLLWPLRSGRTSLSARAATGAAAVGAAVAVVNALTARPEAPTDAVLWAPGLLAPLVGVLAVRGRTPWAVAVTAVTVVCVHVVAVQSLDPMRVPHALGADGPVLLWLVGGLVVRRLVRSTDLELRRSDGAFALARERRERTRARAAARDRRQALLARTAAPLLERVAASTEPPSPELRRQLTAVEGELRAEIRGRDLLDHAVRDAAARARARGVRVDVVDHAPPGVDAGVLARLRSLVAAALRSATDGELTARRPPHGPSLTLVHVGSPRSLVAVAGAVRDLAPSLRGLDVEVDDDEDAVVVEVSY